MENEIQKENEEIIEKEEQAREYHYIYFNEIHDVLKEVKIEISKEYEGFNTLEILDGENPFKSKYNSTQVLKIGRFKLYPEIFEQNQPNKNIIINLEQEGKKEQFTLDLEQIDIHKDYFEYDLNKKVGQIDLIRTSYEEQLDIYYNFILNKLNKKQDSKEIEEFILSTQRLISSPNVKYSFHFFMSIFIKCLNTKILQKNILLFDTEKINEIGIFSEEEINEFRNLLANPTKLAEEIIIDEEAQKQDIIHKLYFIIFCFNCYFNIEELKNMLDNKEIFENIYNDLFIHRKFLQGLTINKEQANKLIEKVSEFKQISTVLNYLGNNFLDIINLINTNFEKIVTICSEKVADIKDKKSENIYLIKIDNYIVPNSKDNIEEIFHQINQLITIEKANKCQIVKFTPELFIPYINYNANNNLNNLIFLKEIILEIRKLEKKFEFKEDLNEYIHQTGLKLIEEKKLNNKNILFFIERDVYYIDKNYAKDDNHRSLKVLDGIDIKTLDMQEWKYHNFKDIFKNQIDDYAKKIVSFVKHMKDFGKLYDLFNIEENENIPNAIVNELKNRYKELIKTYKDRVCPNFLDDSAKLLRLIHKNKMHVNDFLKGLENSLDNEIINKILIRLSEGDISSDLKKKIVDYFMKEKYLNTTMLLYIINNCHKMQKELFQGMDIFILKEEEVFDLEENEKFLLLKGLIDNKIVGKNFEKNGEKYGLKTMELLSNLTKKLENFDISFRTLNQFMINEKYEGKLLDILFYLYLKDQTKSRRIFSRLKAKYKEIQEVIKKYDKVIKYLSTFSPKSNQVFIQNIKSIIDDITKSDTLNTFDKKYKMEFSKYEEHYKKSLEMEVYINSIFFMQIFKETKKQYENYIEDDSYYLSQTKDKFNELKKLFENKGSTSKINPQLLEMCKKAINEKPEYLEQEIRNLLHIFDIKDFAFIEKIYDELLLLSQKGMVFDVSVAIEAFLNVVKGKTTKFLTEIKKINKLIREKEKLEVVRDSKKKLKEFGINIDDEGNNYLKILLELKQNPECIQFLFSTSLEECGKLREIALESENNIVSINDIIDMERCIEFLQNLGSLKDKTDIQIINILKEKVAKQYDIIIYFKKYVANFAQIKTLRSSMNKSENLKYQIDAIFKDAIFEVNNDNDKLNSFICSFNIFEKESINIKKLYEDDINSLRDRAQLAKNMTEDYKYLIEVINETIEIHSILRDICKKGYPKKLRVQVKLNKEQKGNETVFSTKYFMDLVQKEKPEDIKEILNGIFSELKKIQNEAYETKPLIRFFYGRKFNLLNDHVHKLNDSNIGFESFLKYVTNDSVEKFTEKFVPENSPDIIRNNIIDCEKYLTELFDLNKLTLEKIGESSLLKEKDKYNGLYTYHCEKLELNLFQIYKHLTGNPPLAQNILLCNKVTYKEEIYTFIYRAVKCEYNSCFVIAGVENLEYELTSYMLELFDKFFQNDNKINSCIIFLYTNNDAEISVNMALKRYKKILDIDESYKKEKYEGTDIEIIQSDKSGIGKSTHIKQAIESKGKKWVHFPFGDVLKREEIINRLKTLKVDDKSVVHLDLYDTDNISLMIEFLFSFLILRYFGKDEDVFYLSKKVEIKIEIPNTFINFIEKFNILTLFNITEMKILELESLIVPKEINSDIQIVSNYLKCLKEKKIADYDLIIPGITPESLIEISKLVIKYKKSKTTFVTAMDAQILNPEECQNLIFEMIKSKITNPTYYQITSFINILAVQFKKFNQNYFLNAHNLKMSAKSIFHMRNYIIENFIEITKYFTEGAFTNLLKNQDIKHELLFGNYDRKQENKENENAVNNLAKDQHKVMSFKNIDSTLVFFHEGVNESFSIITNKDPKDQEYINYLELKNCQVYRKEEKLKYLPKFNEKNFDKKKFLEELKNILAVNNPITNDEKKRDNNSLKSFEEITDNYVITPDNFIKMILILLRIRSNIPVIMMGETGCGKTSLIRKLSELKNNGDSSKMRILNVHAGTDDKDIVNFIEKEVLPYAEELKYLNDREKKSKESQGMLFEPKKLWVFLDEINTCKSMGLISELMCKHSYQGKKLPENIVFIAACNPYRKRDKKAKKQIIGLDANLAVKEKKNLSEKEKEDLAKNNLDLVYLVNPLPHSLLNFVFDFGGLEEEDEESYIRCIIEDSIEKIFYNGEKETLKNNKKSIASLKLLKQFAQNMVIYAHKFIKKHSDRSAVSLREIRRFNIFYEFFYKYLQNRKKNVEEEKDKQILNKEEENFYQNLGHFESQIYSINLSIFLCYYLRITEKELRDEFVKEINKIFQNDELGQKKKFLEIPKREEQFLVDNIKLDLGIAKNRALLENIFSIFSALNSKVPIFIVGKPGCSKSLSFQLINKSMQAGGSESTFFRKYPKLLVIAFQGSMTSTSKGVESVFEKAHENYHYLSKTDREKNISMIFFDEMGLAEHSPNNPLKVIHSKLEYDENEGENKIAFLGISNWSLDAAKMNRGISISIPDLSKEDNIETSLTIGKSYDENLAVRYEQLFKTLGLVYYEYKDYLNKNYRTDGKQDFHGNRDFYHLIKIFTRNLINYDQRNQLNDDTLMESAINSVERNFGGMILNNDVTSVQKFKELLYKNYPQINILKDYDVAERAKENIHDQKSRYLLVITKGSSNLFLISSLLIEDKEFSIYIGSKFKNDLNKEDYASKIMNKIQTDMEEGRLLILKDLETVYPHMYDLFNQNFTVLGGKNYSRISVGDSINAFLLVNDKFKCIVNVDINKIYEEEPPFLNRFEKHIITFEDLLNKELIELSKEIYSKLSDLAICDEELKSINYSLEKLLINCSLDEIQALIYKAYNGGKKTKDEIYNFILSKIALTLPQDIIISMKYGKFQRNNQEYYDRIMKLYLLGEHTNFANFLKNCKQNKNIVYTFSHKMEKIENVEKYKIKRIIIGMLKRENELEKLLDDFFINDYIICTIHLMPHEGEFMNYINNLIERKEKEYKDKKKKCFIFIVHMLRVSKEEVKNLENENDKKSQEIKNKILNESLSNLSGYYQIFIDNLNGDEKLRIEKILNLDDKTLFDTFKVEEELPSFIFKAITYMKYTISNSCKGLNKDNYIKELTDFIFKNQNLKQLINKCVYKEFVKGEDNNIIGNIFNSKETRFSLEVIDIATLIKKKLLKTYSSMISILFFKLEKNQYFSSILSNEFLKRAQKKSEKEEKKDILESIYESYLDNYEFNDGKFKIVEDIKKNKVDVILGFRYPGIESTLKNIVKEINERISIKYRENENNLRKILDNIEEETNYYLKMLKIYNNLTTNIINNNFNIKMILEKNKNDEAFSEELFNIIKHDYFYSFLVKNIKEKRKENNEGLEEQIIYDFEDNINFMDLIYNTRNAVIKRYFKQKENDKDLDIISRLANIFNFIESYSSEITKINQMFLKLAQQIPELYSQIEGIINNREIKFEISERNPEYSSIVNEAFFISVDSMIRVIISNENIYDIKDKTPDDIIFDLINAYKEILQNALSLNNELTIRSKESVSLQEILKLFDAFSNIKQLNFENMVFIIRFFKNETKYNNNDDGYNLCSNFDIFCQILLKKFEKNENKKFNIYKTLGFIFLNEYLKITNKDFRILLFEKILEKNELIINSSQLFKIILENVVDIRGTEMIDNLKNIKEDKSPLWKMMNNTQNEFLDEVLLNIFEEKIVSFFDSINKLDNDDLKELYPQYYKDNNNAKIKNETGIIFDNSFDIFKQVAQFLDAIIDLDNQINNNNENTHLAKLYSIVYIKYYLYKVVYIIMEKKKEIKNRDKVKEIMQFIKDLSIGLSRVLKIYIFKLFYNFLNNNYEEFKVFDFKEYFVDFLQDFNTSSDDENNSFLTYFFLPLDDDDYKKYSKEMELFDLYQKNRFKTATSDLANLIKEYGFDIFLTVSINKVISNLGFKNYLIDNVEYSNFSSFIKSLFDSEDLMNNKLKKLLYLLYDSDNFQKKKILFSDESGVINPKLYEILLYGFRLCINVLANHYQDNDKNYLYKSILDKKAHESIEKSYIPGIDITEDFHLVYLENVIEHFKSYQDTYGCYVCDCGFYYGLAPCGFPVKANIFDCAVCHKPLGYAPKTFKDEGSPSHGMLLRKGHLRIFKNKEAKEIEMGRFNESDENFPNMTLDEYMKKVIEPIKNKCKFGFNPVSRSYFESQQKEIRQLSEIGYRLLNFIAYSFLFFSFCTDCITKEKLSKYLIEDMNILQIIETDWKFLSEALKKKNINSTQIFMNMIFKKLTSKLKECKFLKKAEEREKFEKEIEQLISDCIDNYNIYKEKYDQENKAQQKASNYSFKSILNELVEPKEEIYAKKEYPYFKYFRLTKYKTLDDFEKRMPSREKYILTNLLLIKIDELQKLEYLPDFNEFINLMLEEYSFKISREEAKKRCLNDEAIFKNDNFKKKFRMFLKAWNQIKNDSTKFECREEMPVKSLSESDKLNNFLNDDGEMGGGMYIAAAYSKFIEWQNNILKPIIDSNQLGGILNNYVNFMEKKIPVQNASSEQIVLIDKRIKDSKYSDLKDIIYSFSERNIFSKSDKIAYSDYNNFIYDYDSIEEELGRIILPGVCQFESEKKLNFVAYWSEGFRGGNSEIFIKIYEKYKQEDLSEDELKNIKEYIIRVNKENINIYDIKKDFKEFLGSFQILLFFLSENAIFKEDDTLETIFKNSPKYLKISEDCEHFCKNEGKGIKIDKMMNLFFIFEHLCFDDFSKNLQEDYTIKIDNQIKERIKEKLLKNYSNKVYSLKDLSSAVRRYISRYLVGSAQTIEINNNNQLPFELTRQELWEKRVWGSDNDLEDVLKRHIGEFNLQVKHTYDFYNLIGGEDMKEIQILNEGDGQK